MGKYADIASALSERLMYHTGVGKLLAGVNVDVTPGEDVEGIKDFPSVRLYPGPVSETYEPFPYVEARLTFTVTAATRRDLGADGHLQLVEKVMDAMETGASGLDLTFGGLVGRPMTFAVESATQTRLGWHSEITVELAGMQFERGTRRT